MTEFSSWAVIALSCPCWRGGQPEGSTGSHPPVGVHQEGSLLCPGFWAPSWGIELCSPLVEGERERPTSQGCLVRRTQGNALRWEISTEGGTGGRKPVGRRGQACPAETPLRQELYAALHFPPLPVVPTTGEALVVKLPLRATSSVPFLRQVMSSTSLPSGFHSNFSYVASIKAGIQAALFRETGKEASPA